jgi:hypothetical protein
MPRTFTDTYDAEFETPEDRDPELMAAVDQYAKSPRVDSADSQLKEKLAQLREESDAENIKFRWDKQSELADEAARMGRILHYQEFIRLLRRAIPARYNNAGAGGFVGLNVLVPTYGGGEWVYAGGVQFGYMPEYSVMRFDDHDVPTNEKFRGWRTVLARLVIHGYITEEQAEEIFGAPTGYVSWRYRQQLHAYRNRGNHGGFESVGKN